MVHVTISLVLVLHLHIAISTVQPFHGSFIVDEIKWIDRRWVMNNRCFRIEECITVTLVGHGVSQKLDISGCEEIIVVRNND